MEILLIDPVTAAGALPVGQRRRLRRGIGYPGLGLLTVAALTPDPIRVRVVDEAVEPIDPAWTPDLVGIAVLAPTATYAYTLAERYRRRRIPVVLGGIHVSLNPQDALGRADAIVTGEAELTWPALLQDFAAGRLQPIYRATSLADLNVSPRPRRELLRRARYRMPAVVQASKGCPFGCEFCSLHAYLGHVTRQRALNQVIAEIRSLPGKEVLFADDNFYADPDYAAALVEALTPLGKRWVAEATWQMAFDEKLLTQARRSGCAGLFVGFDSINPQTMMRKVPPDAERLYVEAMRRIHAAGLAVVAAFVFGLDNDDPSVFARSLRVALDGGADLVNFSALVPYPGTPVFKRLESEGRILERDWSRYISPNVCYRPAQMSPAELRAGVTWSQRQFYTTHHIAHRCLQAMRRSGWGMALFSLALNLSQKRNWGSGARNGE